MKKLLVVGVSGLLMLSQAQAQTPAPSDTAAAPSNTSASASAAAPAACEGADKAQLRKCNQEKLKAARKALNRKIAEACKKQGVKGSSLLTCRADMMAKAADAIN